MPRRLPLLRPSQDRLRVVASSALLLSLSSLGPFGFGTRIQAGPGEVEDDPGHEGTTFSVPEVQAHPGDVVEVPIQVASDVGIVLATFSLRYEAGSLSASSPALPPLVEDLLARNSADSSLVWSANDAVGRFQASLVTDFLGRGEFAIPAGSTDLALLRFQVSDDTPAGAYPLHFLQEGDDGAESEFEDAEHRPVFNHARREGVEFQEEEEFEDGEDLKLRDGSVLVSIIGDVTVFARGDANTDRHIDISDPVMVLGYLFLGDTRVTCADACDANDDGIINLSDSIDILQYLFSPAGGRSTFTTELAPDPTPDDLDCASY